MRLSQEQFEGAIRNTQLRGRAMLAARAVLVEGARQMDAAAARGIKPQSVRKAIRRISAAMGAGDRCPMCGRLR